LRFKVSISDSIAINISSISWSDMFDTSYIFTV
jgi:hypothetical protein